MSILYRRDVINHEAEWGLILTALLDYTHDCFRNGVKVYIYSSGSVQAQKLLFSHSTEGDLTKYLDSHFDITSSGNKKTATSYTRIAAALGVDPSEIVFCSDDEKELKAAKAAGIRHAIMTIRPGNAPLTSDGKKEFPQIFSLLQLCGA